MRVIYHGINGSEHVTTWPEGTKATDAVRFQKRMFDFAGVQDGTTHYRERRGG